MDYELGTVQVGTSHRFAVHDILTASSTTF